MSVPAELTVSNFNIFTAKSEGRDKLARFVQYTARMVMGLISLGRPVKGTYLFDLNDQVGNVMKNLASARRTHRWCKEFPVMQAIIAGLPRTIPREISALKSLNWPAVLEKLADMAQKIMLATFLVTDHIGWLKQMKILRGGKRAGTGTIQLGLTWFCASNFVGMLVQSKKFYEVKDEPEKRQKFAENALKHALLVIQTAHLSRTYETHDIFVGVCGMLSSAMDVLLQWPQKKLLPSPKPEEKEGAAAETTVKGQPKRSSPDAKAISLVK